MESLFMNKYIAILTSSLLVACIAHSSAWAVNSTKQPVETQTDPSVIIKKNQKSDTVQVSPTQTNPEVTAAPEKNKRAHKDQGHSSGTIPAANEQAPSAPSPSAQQKQPAIEAAIKNIQDAQGATARCKDNTYSHSQQHRGACSRHGGVDSWLQQSN
jgi:hypothetical protein